MTLTLADVKGSINRFLHEAEMCTRDHRVPKRCSKEQYGFAAMLTAFSVILGVSEAVQGRQRNQELFRWFMSQIEDQDLWIIIPESEAFSDDSIGKKLAQTRDSLAHQFSLPLDVDLVSSVKLKRVSGRDAGRYIIGVREFVRMVQRTVDRIVQTHPNAAFDADSKGLERGAANRVLISDAPPMSGSSAKGTVRSTSVTSSNPKPARRRDKQ